MWVVGFTAASVCGLLVWSTAEWYWHAHVLRTLRSELAKEEPSLERCRGLVRE